MMSIFSIKVGIALLFSFGFFACSHENKTPIMQPLHYLALGDSYTIGQGVEESERWPNLLSEMLAQNGVEIAETKIIAQTGWKTSNLIQAIADSDLTNFNLVSLLIGVNNQFSGQSFEIFTSEFDSLLSISIDLAGNKEKVFVVSIPDYGVTPFGNANSENIAQEIDMYNSYIKQKCNEQNILFIDITEISRQLGALPGSLAPDNLHPSGNQYSLWVDEIFPKVNELLTK
jgi:lysophospholipase L1-like esterase